MKTRAEIYGNEAAALLRIVTMYPGLNMQQLLCFHPGKEEIIKTLLSHLQKQGRIFQTDTGGYFPSGWAAKSDNSLIRAVWVLLDFIGQVEYHAPGDFPVKLIFFANGELYEIVYAASGQEALINHALRDDRSGGRRIIWSIIRKTFAALTALAFPVSAPWMQRARCITLRKQEELDWNENHLTPNRKHS